MEVCQATKTEPATTVIPSQSPDGPYFLSADVAQRLKNLALRPLEWFNLAVIHGPLEYYLHDDFYDDDGTAHQPQTSVIDADRFPAPTLSQCVPSLDSLLDFAKTRWHLRPPVVEEIARYDQDRVLIRLRKSFLETKNIWFKRRLLEIAAAVLCQRAAQFFRDAVAKDSATSNLLYLSQAGACVPPDEGVVLAQQWLAALPPQEIAGRCLVMRSSSAPQVLIGLRRIFASRLRLSGVILRLLRWSVGSRLKWLQSGRPLSLVALDALCHVTGLIPAKLGSLRSCVRAFDPAALSEMEVELQRYLQRVHRRGQRNW
jgi:hypothetical protein